MSANIGGTNATFVRELDATPAAERVDVWEQAGYSGVGVQLLGKTAGMYEFEAVLFGTIAECKAWFSAIAARVGTVVTIETDRGDQFENLAIVGHRRTSYRVAATPSNINRHRAAVRITCKGV